jgi:2-haloacid dehalogenase
MQPEIKTVIFDLGGVLIDWNPDYVYREIYPDPVQRKWFFDNICTHDWNMQQDAGRPLSEATEEKVSEFPEYEDQIRAFYGRWKEMLGDAIYENVRLLDQVVKANGHRVYALTNWSHETFPVALDRFEFLQWFEGIVVSGEEKTIKPLREIYEILFHRYDIEPSKALFIDDNKDNVAGAVNAGMHAVHYTTHEQLRHDLASFGILP